MLFIHLWALQADRAALLHTLDNCSVVVETQVCWTQTCLNYYDKSNLLVIVAEQ